LVNPYCSACSRSESTEPIVFAYWAAAVGSLRCSRISATRASILPPSPPTGLGAAVGAGAVLPGAPVVAGGAPVFAGGAPVVAGGAPVFAGGAPVVAGGAPVVA